jgi:hypothetical protein
MDPKKNQKADDYEPKVGPAGAHNSGQMAADTPHQVGTTPAMPGPNQTTDPTQDLGLDQGRRELSNAKNAHALDKEDIPERAGIARIAEQDIKTSKVNPGAVRESYAEAQNDPIAETKPEDGEEAA